MEKDKNRRSIFAELVSRADIRLLSLRNRVKHRILSKLTATWVVIPTSIVLSILILVAHREWFGSPPIPKSSAELFFGIGTVTGAMLAIVFAFSSQLISRASEALPTRYFKIFARDTVLDLYYIALGLVTVLEFVLGVISLSKDGSVNTLLVRIGIWLILLTIILLYFSYIRLIKLLSHEYQVTWLAKYYKDQIDEISYIAKRVARASLRGYKNLSSQEKAVAEGQAHESLRKQTQTLIDDLDGIIELYFTYKSRGDDYAAHNYIQVASGLIMSYTLSRQNNTLARSNPQAGLILERSILIFTNQL